MFNDNQSSGLFLLIKKLYSHIYYKRKVQLIFLLGIMIFSTLLEILTIGSVLPFISILASPEKILNNYYTQTLKNTFHLQSTDEIIFTVSFLFIFFVLFSGALRIFLVWITNRFTAVVGSEISSEVYKRIIYQPYINHISQNSSDIINTLSHKVDSVVLGTIFPILAIINSIFLIIAIFISLLVIDPIISLSSMIIFGLAYFLIATFVRSIVKMNSKSIVINQSRSIKLMQESLGGIRDMILEGNQETYLKIYKSIEISTKKSIAQNNFIGLFPKYSMEVISMIIIAILAYSLTLLSGSLEIVLPTLGAIAIGSQRMLPAVQQTYNGWVGIVGNSKQLFDIINYLETPVLKNADPTDLIDFKHTFQLENLSFRYNDSSPLIIENINLTIKKGDRVGLVGTTGSGKSTLLDIVMGLLPPTYGNILIDGRKINSERIILWQKKIAHVPQFIFLVDATILENIAFGVPKEFIDIERVKISSKMAMVNEFVDNLPNGFDTIVGERGIFLSGGQRQRIGIARALYKNAEILILDEATSALDNETEKEVMNSITSFDKNLTILMIAHRISTLVACDYIIEVKNRNIADYDKTNIMSQNFITSSKV